MLYIFPNVITICNFVCGVLSIYSVLFLNIYASIAFICIGALFDLMDGFIARKCDAVSEFGKELDSLSDIVTFCVAPSILVYTIALSDLGTIGLLAALVFSVCGLIRLARFNATQSTLSTFIGMPVPLAALCLLVLAFLLHPILLAVGTCLLGYLMVSRVKFPHFKNKVKKWDAENGAH